MQLRSPTLPARWRRCVPFALRRRDETHRTACRAGLGRPRRCLHDRAAAGRRLCCPIQRAFPHLCKRGRATGPDPAGRAGCHDHCRTARCRTGRSAIRRADRPGGAGIPFPPDNHPPILRGRHGRFAIFTSCATGPRRGAPTPAPSGLRANGQRTAAARMMVRRTIL